MLARATLNVSRSSCSDTPLQRKRGGLLVGGIDPYSLGGIDPQGYFYYLGGPGGH